MGQKRGRFGRTTGATLRRIPTWRSSLTAQDVCVIQKKVDNEKKQEILAEFESQFEDGGLGSTDYPLFYSLNKCKRWELPNLLKDNIMFDPVHETNEFEVILVERSIGIPSSKSPDCTGIHKSKGEIHSKQPRNKYAHVHDLINVEQNAKISNAKRNSGNRKKRSRTETEDIERDPTPCLKYEVSYARPRKEYPHFAPTLDHKGDFAKRIAKKGQRPNKCHLEFEEDDDDDYYSDHFDCDDGYIGDEESIFYVYDPEFSMGPPPLLSLSDHLDFSDTQTRSPKKSKLHKKKLKKNTTCDEAKISGKDHKITIPSPDVPTTSINNQPAATMALSPDILPTLPPTTSILITKSSIIPECLETIFKSDYTEGASLPRRFLIDVTSHVQDTLLERGMSKAATQLRKMGRRFLVIFTKIQKGMSESFVNYARTEKNGELLEEVDDFRVCLFGLEDQFISNYEYELKNALSNSNTFSATDVITAIKTILDQLPVDYFYTDVKTSKGALCHLAYNALQQHLQQVSEVMTPHALHQMTTTNETIKILNAQILQQSSCGICFEDLLPSSDGYSGTALGSCQHWFCNDCWKHHIHTRVGRGDCSILCPEYQCDSKVDTPTLMSLTSSSQFQNHMTHKQNRIVDNDPSLHWCPEPGCGHVGKVCQCSDGEGFVPCDCGKAWCVGCKEDVHWPALCEQAEEYLKTLRKREEDKRSHKIMSVRVKKCPHCNRRMEKNGGCPNMVCFCGKIFCWICLQPHSYSPSCSKLTAELETVELYPVMIGVTKDEILRKAIDFKKMASRTAFTKMKRGVVGVLTKMHAKTIKQNSDNKNATKGDLVAVEKRICSWCRTEEQMKIHTEAVAMADQVAEFYTEVCSQFAVSCCINPFLGLSYLYTSHDCNTTTTYRCVQC
ncbi:uncharacterized protein LOC117103367 [Anneissia japonica]|uniref:uncharacterized protein LOC117103367 n=1 Tax=Anneissia japonica TaxID=1529436 RepID=UPI001425947D|nr:uncharacterized protein LOC117103367 [Anneissia japonica]